MDKILIIGGCGYIGTRLMQFLTTNGFDVTSVDLEWFEKHSALPTINQDFRHLDARFIAQYNTVILLAGHSSVKMCENNLHSCFQNNVVNFIGLLHKIRPGQKFIYASSSSIYGGLENTEMLESSVLYKPLNYYDLSKYEIDSYAKLSSNIEYYGLRFGTVNGFSLNLRDDIMLNSMYSSFLNRGEIRYSNPNINRPILGITDLCRAVVAILNNGTYEKRGIYNLASFNASVKTIATKAADFLHSPLIPGTNSSSVYDFSISTKLFQETFSFEFTQTIESILTELVRGREQVTFTNRNNPQKYE